MNIKLPKQFKMESKDGERLAYIEKGVLKIKRNTSLRRVMTEITFEIKGKNRCCYCGDFVPEDEITIDHMYPQDFGGPTISDNMLPSCKKCNGEKGNLNTRQYKKYLKAKKEGTLRECKEEIAREQRNIRRYNKFDIPENWIAEKELSNIIAIFNLGEEHKNHKYQKIVKHYEIYGSFQRPIIIDKNGFLLDGFLTLLYAKNNELKSIPTIQLDNVEVIL